jgi:hypothetical protein
VAIQAAWRMISQVNNSIAPSPSEIQMSWFFGFLEGKLPVLVPELWKKVDTVHSFL